MKYLLLFIIPFLFGSGPLTMSGRDMNRAFKEQRFDQVMYLGTAANPRQDSCAATWSRKGQRVHVYFFCNNPSVSTNTAGDVQISQLAFRISPKGRPVCSFEWDDLLIISTHRHTMLGEAGGQTFYVVKQVGGSTEAVLSNGDFGAGNADLVASCSYITED
jgi:hypothetical protein